jgi:glutamine amidotransferase
MPESTTPTAAIVDYGMGNLFSVKHACEHAGLVATITSSPHEILSADAVILPGVGAFGDAMDSLAGLDLIATLKEFAASSKPLVGICLGLQLLMTESYEFGRHVGLGLLPGSVVRFEDPRGADGTLLKVPQVCWNQVYRSGPDDNDPWAGTLLEGVPDGVYMYFVHSYYVRTTDASTCIGKTSYGDIEFCSALAHRNIFALQCHPERSGSYGLQVYRNLATRIRADRTEATA